MRRGAARIARRGSSRGHRAKGPIRAAAHRSGSIQPFSLRVLCPDLAPAFRRPFARAPQRGIARCRPRPSAREPHRAAWNDRAAVRRLGRGCGAGLRARRCELRRLGGRRIRGAVARFFRHDPVAVDGGDRQCRDRSSARARRRRTPQLHRCRRALSGSRRRC